MVTRPFRAEVRQPLCGWRTAVGETAVPGVSPAGFSTSQDGPWAEPLAPLEM